MKSKTHVFKDRNETIYDFGNKFLVDCPKCEMFAQIVPSESDEKETFWQNPRLICSYCGYNKDNESVKKVILNESKATSYARIGGNYDWYFLQPLWLQINCCVETLWAYNEKHLEFIEDYVLAKMRQRTSNKNSSLASRLPKWITSSKNRNEILKAIKKLKEKL